MPKIQSPVICAECHVAMPEVQEKVIIVEMFLVNRRPFKIWDAKLYQCPIDGRRVVIRQGSKAKMQWTDIGFDDMAAKEMAEAKHVIREYDRRKNMRRKK